MLVPPLRRHNEQSCPPRDILVWRSTQCVRVQTMTQYALCALAICRRWNVCQIVKWK